MNIELDKRLTQRILDVILRVEEQEGYENNSYDNLIQINKIMSAIFNEAENDADIEDYMKNFELDYTPGKIDFLNYIEAANELFGVAENINYIENLIQSKPNLFVVDRAFSKLQDRGVGVGNAPINVKGLRQIQEKLVAKKSRLEKELVHIYEKNRQIKEYEKTLLKGPNDFGFKDAVKLYNELYEELKDKGVTKANIYETWIKPESKEILFKKFRDMDIPWINEVLNAYDLTTEYGQLDVISFVYHMTEGIIVGEMAKISKMYELETNPRSRKLLYDEMVSVGNSVRQEAINDLVVNMVSYEYSVQGPKSKKEALQNRIDTALDGMDEDTKSMFRQQLRDYKDSPVIPPEEIAPENLYLHIDKNVIIFNKNILGNTIKLLKEAHKQKRDAEFNGKLEQAVKALNEKAIKRQQQIDYEKSRQEDRKPFTYSDRINIELTEEGAMLFEGSDHINAETIYIDRDQVSHEPSDIAKRIEKILGLKKHIYDYGINAIYKMGNERLLEDTVQNGDITDEILGALDPNLIEAFYVVNKNKKYSEDIQMNLVTYITSAVEDLKQRKGTVINLDYTFEPEEKRLAKPSIFNFFGRRKTEDPIYSTGDEMSEFTKYINKQRGLKFVEYIDTLIKRKGLERARSELFSLPSVQNLKIKRTEIGHTREDLIYLVFRVLREEDQRSNVTDNKLILAAKNDLKKGVHYNTPSQYENDRLTTRETYGNFDFYATIAKNQGFAQVSEEQPMIIAKKGYRPFSRPLVKEYNQRLLENGLYRNMEKLQYYYEMKEDNLYTVEEGMQEFASEIKDAVKRRIPKFIDTLKVKEVTQLEVPLKQEEPLVLKEKEKKIPKLVKQSSKKQDLIKNRIKSLRAKNKLVKAKDAEYVRTRFPKPVAIALLPVASKVVDVLNDMGRI